MSDVATQIGSYGGYISLSLMIVGSVIAFFNHRRCRSTCFGREATVSLDIEATTPNDKKLTSRESVNASTASITKPVEG
jgi:hypothetical protein